MAENTKFSAGVDAWVRQTQARTEAVFKLSAQYLIEDLIQRTPRDTGFLVNSLTVTLNGLPDIQSDAKPAPDAGAGSYQPKPYAFVIQGADIYSTISAGFVAAYAAHVEYGTKAHTITPKDAQALHFEVGGEGVFASSVEHPGTKGAGMVRLAAQNWPQHVARASVEIRGRVEGR